MLNGIETQRACWLFHAVATLSFKLVVGHVSAVRTRLVTNEDEAFAVVCCEGSYCRFEYLFDVALRFQIPRITPVTVGYGASKVLALDT